MSMLMVNMRSSYRLQCLKQNGSLLECLNYWIHIHTLIQHKVSIGFFSDYGAHFRHWCLKSEIIQYVWLTRAVYLILTTKHNVGFMSGILENTNSISLNRWCNNDVWRLSNKRHLIRVNVLFTSMIILLKTNDVQRSVTTTYYVSSCFNDESNFNDVCNGMIFSYIDIWTCQIPGHAIDLI